MAGVLNQEMKESICKCFTGRMSRLINSLNGYDERVNIRISNSQEISNIIVSIRHKTDDIDKQKGLVVKELSERGYSKEIMNEWLSFLE